VSRAYAQVYKDIWADDDFRNLENGPQRLYLFLISQPNINYAGVLMLSPRRWASRSKRYSVEELMADLAVLVERRYILVDEEEEELLVRSYIRNDGLWKNPKTMKSAHRDALATSSRRLRHALAEELRRLPLEDLQEGTRAGITRDVQDLIARLSEGILILSTQGSDPLATPSLRGSQGVATPSEQGADGPGGDPSPDRSYGPGDGAGVGEESFPPYFSSLGQDQPDPPGPVAEDGDGVLISLPRPQDQSRKPEPGSDADPEFVAFWKAYPRKIGKPRGRKAWRAALKKGHDPAAIITAAQDFRDDPVRRSKSIDWTPYPASWLNDERYVVEVDDDGDDGARDWNTGVVETFPEEFNR
jgi:hypothetical protein